MAILLPYLRVGTDRRALKKIIDQGERQSNAHFK
jgi:hypothetical protein